MAPRLDGRFAEGVEVLRDGTELHLASFNVADAELRLAGDGHAASVVFARKPDGTWRICYDYRGLNAITRPAVEPHPHIDALLDGTRGSCFFTKLDLASSYHQLRVRASDRWKTSFRSQLGQFEWNVVPIGLQG